MTALETRLDLLAASGETITYGDLARELGLRMGELTTALEALMEQDAAEGHPFRAALCAGRMNDGLPATGFFLKAAELGRYGGGDRGAYITAERAALRR